MKTVPHTSRKPRGQPSKVSVPVDFTQAYSFGLSEETGQVGNAHDFALKVFAVEWDISSPGTWKVLKDGFWLECSKPEEIARLLDTMLDFHHHGQVPFTCHRDWQPGIGDCVTIEFKEVV